MKKMLVCLMMSCLIIGTCVGCSNKPSGGGEGNSNISSEDNSSEKEDGSENAGTTEKEDGSEDAGTTEKEDGSENVGATEEQGQEIVLEELFQKGMDSYAAKNIEAPVLFPETDITYLENFYPGIGYANIKQIYVAMAPVTNAPMEVVLIEVADSSDVAAIRDILQERIDERANDTAYPEESAVWKKNAKVTIRGNFIFMAVMTDDYGIPEEFILD